MKNDKYSDKGYIPEVRYPKELHKLHNYFLFLLQMKIEKVRNYNKIFEASSSFHVK